MNVFVVLTTLLLASVHAVPVQNTHTSQPRALFVVHRHGERTLAATFGGDPLNNATIWPDGLAQITIEGRRRMYRLGEFLRRKYEATVGINPKNVYVRSSGIDRCLESAQMVAHAMYPPVGRWNWNALETWQPISIYTIYKPNDGMLNPGAFCPAAKQEEASILKNERCQYLHQKFTPLYKEISKHIGFEVNDIFTAKGVYDSISTAKVNNKPIPDWVTDEMYSQLIELYDATFEIEFSTRRMQRFRTGVLLNEIKDRLQSLVSPPPPKQEWTGIRWDDINDRHKNVFIYSTHDSMIAALLSSFQVFDNMAPPFGASILIEVFGPNPDQASVSNQTLIQIGYLKHTETQNVRYVKLPVCNYTMNHQPACSYDQFIESIADLEMPMQQWNVECMQTAVEQN